MEDGDERLGIVDLGSAASRDVRNVIDNNLRAYGMPFRSGSALSPSCLPLLGAGSVAASSLAAGNVFLATANPSTLMTIGGGVGSAVMGSGGIVAQAPFVAASTAILPVVAPLAIFMTVSSTMMAVRVDRLQKSLDSLTEAIGYLLKKDVMEDYARVLSAVARLRDLSQEFHESQRFTDEMKIRLALVERDLSVARYEHSLAVDASVPRTDARASGASVEMEMGMLPVELHLYALSSVAGIHVDGLRLKLAVQENPADLDRRIEGLHESIRAFRSGTDKLAGENWLAQYLQALQDSLDEMAWWQQKWGHGKALAGAAENAREILEGRLAQVLDVVGNWSETIASLREEARQQSIIYYRDRKGEGEPRAYYTDDLLLEPER